jgi:hypothetical protein
MTSWVIVILSVRIIYTQTQLVRHSVLFTLAIALGYLLLASLITYRQHSCMSVLLPVWHFMGRALELLSTRN